MVSPVEGASFIAMHPLHDVDESERVMRKRVSDAKDTVRKDINNLGKIAIDLRDNFEVVMAAVTTFGQALKYAGPDARENVDIVVAAVSQNGTAYRDVYYSMLGSNQKVIEATGIYFASHPECIEMLPEEMRELSFISLMRPTAYSVTMTYDPSGRLKIRPRHPCTLRFSWISAVLRALPVVRGAGAAAGSVGK